MKKRMFLSILLLLSLLPTIGLAFNEDLQQQRSRFQQGLLFNAVNYLDGVCQEQVQGLVDLAASPAAINGDWSALKPQLEALNAKVPGVYFYLLPDGSYSTIALGKTTLNLTQRSYFKALFEGELIKGVPVYSRSSGKKSVVFAAPVVDAEGHVIAAVAASLFLDELRAQLADEIPFPADHTWFVVNASGDTLLDKDVDYLFMNTMEQGTPSLKKAIAVALTQEQGEITYDVGGAGRKGYFSRLRHVDWWMVLAKKQPNSSRDVEATILTLDKLTFDLQKSIEQIDSSMRIQLMEINSKPHDEADIRKTLSSLLKELPQVIEAVYVNKEGVLIYAEPPEYKAAEGQDISEQSHVKQMIAHHTPLLTDLFATIEGYRGALISHPLYNARNQFVGAISVLFRPDNIVAKQVNGMFLEAGYEVIVMQADGEIIYDQDPTQQGLNLMTDPIYDGYFTLKELGRKMMAEPRGEGTYVFTQTGTTTKVVKRAIWDSVGLHGRFWRVILVQPDK